MLFGIIRSKETSIHIIIYKYLLFIFDIIYLYLFQFEHVGCINPCFLHSLRPLPLHSNRVDMSENWSRITRPMLRLLLINSTSPSRQIHATLSTCCVTIILQEVASYWRKDL